MCDRCCLLCDRCCSLSVGTGVECITGTNLQRQQLQSLHLTNHRCLCLTNGTTCAQEATPVTDTTTIYTPEIINNSLFAGCEVSLSLCRPSPLRARGYAIGLVLSLSSGLTEWEPQCVGINLRKLRPTICC